jgi:hypothetical protein
MALWLAVRSLDVERLRAALVGVDPLWVLAALASNVASLLAVSWRWRLLFHPDHRERRLWPLFRAVVIGQMFNIVVPLRLGEVARMYLAARDEHVSKARVLATLAVEKALDLGVFALALILVLPLFASPGGVGTRQSTVWGVGVAGSLGLWALSRSSDRVTPCLRRAAAALPARLAERSRGIAERFLQGLSALRSPGGSLAAVLWSVAVMAVAASTNYLLFLAFDLALTPLVALFLLVLLQVGSVPPSLPGKIGVFHYVTVVALEACGVDRVTALAYAIVLYSVALLPKVLLGALLVAAGHRVRFGSALD